MNPAPSPRTTTMQAVPLPQPLTQRPQPTPYVLAPVVRGPVNPIRPVSPTRPVSPPAVSPRTGELLAMHTRPVSPVGQWSPPAPSPRTTNMQGAPLPNARMTGPYTVVPVVPGRTVNTVRPVSPVARPLSPVRPVSPVARPLSPTRPPTTYAPNILVPGVIVWQEMARDQLRAYVRTLDLYLLPDVFQQEFEDKETFIEKQDAEIAALSDNVLRLAPDLIANLDDIQVVGNEDLIPRMANVIIFVNGKIVIMGQY